MVLTLPKKRRRHISLIGGGVFIVLSSAVIVVAGLVVWQWYQGRHVPNAERPSSAPVVVSTDAPDETPPEASCSSYGVGAQEPRRLSIERLGVNGCVQRVGIDQHGAVAVPTNIHVAGWYIQSALPGEPGVSLLDGHVLGRYNDAIFAQLKEVQTDDIITVELGNGAQKKFLVLDVHEYTVAEAAHHLFERHADADRQLTLITCSGTFNSKEQSYDKRVIVRAVLST